MYIYIWDYAGLYWGQWGSTTLTINGGSPIAGWFIRENPKKRWMVTRGSPILGNVHLLTGAWYREWGLLG